MTKSKLAHARTCSAGRRIVFSWGEWGGGKPQLFVAYLVLNVGIMMNLLFLHGQDGGGAEASYSRSAQSA